MINGRTLATLIGLMLLSVLALTSAAQQTTPQAPTPSRSQLVVSDAVVRGGPGESFVPVGQLTPDSLLIPVSIDQSGQWVLLRYNRGFGWIRRDLATWTVNLDALPVITSANLTPTIEAGRETATPFFPTSTPRGSYVQTTARSAYVRAGPGRTYLRLSQLFAGDRLEPVSRNDDGSWVMIRTDDGFGWIQRALGVWSLDIDSLPVVDANNLTPTATFTPSRTPSRTPRPSATPSATATATATLTPTQTPSPTVTLTPTLTPSPTATLTPTQTPSPSATLTPTQTPSPSATLTPTLTPSLTATPTPTLTNTSAAVAVIVASDTPTQAPSDTPTLTPTPSPTQAPSDTPTHTASPTATLTPTLTPSLTATLTPTLTNTSAAVAVIVASDTPTQSPSDTPTLTPTPSPTATLTDTPAPAVILDDETPPAPTPVSPDGTDTPSTDSAVNIPTEALVGGVALLAIMIYVALYLRGLSAANRYKDGFILEECPACRQGKLSVDVRQDRLLGIPQPHFTVRCSNCRSVLREVGRGQWRYAVDPLDNPPLYERYNNRTLDERTLLTLHKIPIKPPTTPVTRPDFVEGEQPPPDA